MRILYSHRIQSRDGQGVHVDELVRAFREAGHEVLVVGPAAYDQASFGGESRLIRLVRSVLSGPLGELAELFYNLVSYPRLLRAWRSFRPDLVYERYNLFHLAGSLLARRHGALVFLEVNAPIAEERVRFNGLRLRRLAFAVERYTWRSAHRVLAVSAVLGRMIAAGGVPAERIAVTHNGVVPARFPPREEKAPDAPIVLGFAGFMRAWHGLDEVLRGMASDPGATRLVLVVIGIGPVLDELRALAAELGIEGRVRFEGLVPHEDMPGRVAGFDIALQPKATPYASPLKIFDYMAAGCAIVGPDQENIREILTDGETALLFDPAAPQALWQTVRRLVEDGDLRRRLGVAARAELIRRDYSWAGNAARVVAWAAADRPIRARDLPTLAQGTHASTGLPAA